MALEAGEFHQAGPEREIAPRRDAERCHCLEATADVAAATDAEPHDADVVAVRGSIDHLR